MNHKPSRAERKAQAADRRAAYRRDWKRTGAKVIDNGGTMQEALHAMGRHADTTCRQFPRFKSEIELAFDEMLDDFKRHLEADKARIQAELEPVQDPPSGTSTEPPSAYK